tara:strand:+ start:293 stop:448 length:156 start_codon:yes stop_codon:yes gene_type:complete
MGRVTEFIDFINRKSLKLNQNLKDDDYTYMTITMKVKRARYDYQLKIRKKK